MKIDVSDLLKKKIIKRNIDLIIEEKDFYDGAEYLRYLEPIKFVGKINLAGEFLTLQGTATTKIELTCSRCLEKFSKDIEIEVNEKFSSDNANKDDDYIFIDSDAIDITEIIENNITLSLPIRRLCKEECKGLCQTCGTNLNHSRCNCKNEDIDPRLAKLKELFSSN